jgi:hypothetical protein
MLVQRLLVIVSFIVTTIHCFQLHKTRIPETRRHATVYESPAQVLQGENVPAEGTMFNSPAFKILDFIFGIPIVHDLMFGVYRKQIVEKSEKMGLDWTGFLEELRESLPELQSIAKRLQNPSLTIPEYYYAPIHAYKDGNLCWESAMEEDLWSKLMIAPLYNNALDGDVQMRQQWLAITNRIVGRKSNPPKQATDLGCGTGLSMYMLDSKWPSLEKIQGIDMSIFKLSVCEDKKKLMVSLSTSFHLSPLTDSSHFIAGE